METKQLQLIINNISVREKLAQLTQLTPACFGHGSHADLTGPNANLQADAKDASNIGSTLNCLGAAEVYKVQKKHMESSEKAIPLLFMADIIHGYKTIFPIPLAMACSFEPKYAQNAANIAAKECSVSGIHVTFSPMADIVRDPRWGRVMESSGEDTILNAAFAAACVRGYQGQKLTDKYSIAACVKHFAAYGAPEGGREYNNVELSQGTLEEYYLPAYYAALNAGAKMIMASFNTLNRTPVTASENILCDLLRKQWGFNGVVISDYNAVDELVNHGVAKDGLQAANKALKAQVNIEMMSNHYLHNGEDLVRAGKISINELDAAVMQVLELKNQLGLFENPYKDLSESEEQTLHLCPQHRKAAKEIALSCPVLLKNENRTLPFSKTDMLGLAGPFATERRVLGGWSAGSVEGVSLYDGLCNIAGKSNLHVNADAALEALVEGHTDIPQYSKKKIAAEFKNCNKVIVAVGENQADTGEGASKTNIRLSQNQERLIKTFKELGKTVVAVIFSGRPLEISPILPYCDAVLQAWFLGTESGNALAELLLGIQSPSGKLSMSFPQNVGQVPVYYNRLSSGRPLQNGNCTRYASRYLDCPVEPLFPFGFGLTYGEAVIKSFNLKNNRLTAVIKNISHTDITETLQIYIHQCTASAARPIKKLIAFKRTHLKANEEKSIEFELAQNMLSYPLNGMQIFEEGCFQFFAAINPLNSITINIDISTKQFNLLKRSTYDFNTFT